MYYINCKKAAFAIGTQVSQTIIHNSDQHREVRDRPVKSLYFHYNQDNQSAWGLTTCPSGAEKPFPLKTLVFLLSWLFGPLRNYLPQL